MITLPNPVPVGREAATAYLCCKNAAAAIDFYKKALGATEIYRITMDGLVGHAELQIGATTIMLSDEYPEIGVLSPQTLRGSPVVIFMYVADVDQFTQRALAAGLQSVKPVENQVYGDRGGKFVDPFGHLWWFASRVKELSPDELQQLTGAVFGTK